MRGNIYLNRLLSNIQTQGSLMTALDGTAVFISIIIVIVLVVFESMDYPRYGRFRESIVDDEFVRSARRMDLCGNEKVSNTLVQAVFFFRFLPL